MADEETTPDLDGTPRAGLLPALLERVRRTPPGLALGALGGMTSYLALMRLGTGATRPEQLVLCGVMGGLVVWSDATRRFFLGLLPMLLFGISYDLLHLTQPLTRFLTVHVEAPYRFDQRFLGLHTAAGVLTPNEFFRRHHWPVVDLLTGTAYIVFVYWSIGFAACLALFRRDEAGQRLLRRFGWTFLLLNLAGFATYYVYPAAPPWYVARYPDFAVHMETLSSAAGAIRWDQLTGIPYFAGFYGRSADVFGAIPSLHVAYPLLTWLYGLELRKRWLNWASFGLFALVSFAAVYLDHHYVLDVLLGYAYTLTAYGAERSIRAWRGRRAARLA